MARNIVALFYDEAEKRSADERRHWFTKGLKLLYASAFQDALDALTTAIQIDPERAEAYAYRGFAYHQLENYDAALKDYNKSVEQRPKLVEGYYFRAILYGQHKEHEKAINDYSRAIELEPTLAEAYYFRALNYGATGRYEEAIKDMKTAAELGHELAKEFLRVNEPDQGETNPDLQRCSEDSGRS